MLGCTATATDFPRGTALSSRGLLSVFYDVLAADKPNELPRSQWPSWGLIKTVKEQFNLIEVGTGLPSFMAVRG